MEIKLVPLAVLPLSTQEVLKKLLDEYTGTTNWWSSAQCGQRMFDLDRLYLAGYLSRKYGGSSDGSVGVKYRLRVG